MYQPDGLKTDQPLLWSPGRGNDVWAMLCAARDGDRHQVTRLLARDPSLVRCSHDYRTPLAFAVRENRIEVAALLLERGADPISSGTSDTLLEMARDRGHDRMQNLLERALAGPGATEPRGMAVATAIRARDLAEVRRLLDADPELVHAPDTGTNQPIHWAAMTRQLELIDELAVRGADLNAQRADGARPIQLSNGDYGYRGWRDVPKEVTTTPREVLDRLRARGADCDICTAAAIGDLERVRELLDRDPSLANRPSDYVTYYAGSGTPLRNAAGGGHLEIVRLLLAHGADPNLREEGMAPRGHALYSAAANGHHEIAQLLLEAGAYPNPPVESSADALSRALGNGDQRMVELLGSYGAARPFHMLAYYGDVVTAAAMLAANPALADDPHALENAAGQGHEPFVRLMLKHRPDLPARIAVGVAHQGPQSPIQGRGLVELLFAHGMKPNFQDWLGITPLHRFAERGDLSSATLFLDHGADPNLLDEEHYSTPLGWAARRGQREMVELLLARGADPSLPVDRPWATPWAWAQRRGHKEIEQLLMKVG
jgi:ankyrin repeat protein